MTVLDWDHNAYYHRLLLRQMPQPCRRVLDVGCGAGATMPVVMDPPLTTREVSHQAAAVLPGVRVRRLLFWRYLLIWQKPITPDS